jgi:hypothetical protein
VFLCLFWLLLSPAQVRASDECYDTIRAGGTAHVDSIERYIGLRETHGKNRNPIIDAWNRAVRVPVGSAYCASCVSAMLEAANIIEVAIRSARARAFIDERAIPVADVLSGKYTIKRGDLLIWRRAGGGHIGIAYADWVGIEGWVVEANTSSGKSGSQWNGDGIWIRWRKIVPFGVFRITHVVPCH